MNFPPGTVAGVRGNRWTRPVLGGLLALALLLILLVALDQLGNAQS